MKEAGVSMNAESSSGSLLISNKEVHRYRFQMGIKWRETLKKIANTTSLPHLGKCCDSEVG